MKNYILIAGIIVLSAGLFASPDTGDYQLVTVKSGETLDDIVAKHLKNKKFKSDLLRYNRLSAGDIRPGLKIKIPYSISINRVAKIKFMKGKVERLINGSWVQIPRSGTILLKQDHVRTGINSKLELQFDDGSRLQLQSSSSISLKEFEYSRKGRKVNVSLKGGSLYANVTRLGRSSTFNISSVTALAGVRGTEFYVSLDRNKKMAVEVYKGKVDVTAGNKTVQLITGQETTVKKGSTPSAPRKIRAIRRVQWGR